MTIPQRSNSHTLLDHPWEDLVRELCQISKEAGDAILSVREKIMKVSIKKDFSPVTQADLTANKILTERLTALAPNIPIVSEESYPSFAVRKNWNRYWLIDPLDGTRGFIEGSDDFAVIVALIDNHIPVFGLIYAPALQAYYFGGSGFGAFKRQSNHSALPIQARPCTEDRHHAVIIASFRHQTPLPDALYTRFRKVELIRQSSAIKFGVLAEGGADAYIRTHPTSEWDTAAGQAILEAAGGTVMDFNKNPLTYNNKENLDNPNFLAVGDPSLAWHEYFAI